MFLTSSQVMSVMLAYSLYIYFLHISHSKTLGNICPILIVESEPLKIKNWMASYQAMKSRRHHCRIGISAIYFLMPCFTVVTTVVCHNRFRGQVTYPYQNLVLGSLVTLPNLFCNPIITLITKSDKTP